MNTHYVSFTTHSLVKLPTLKWVVIACSAIFLSGCFDDKSDLLAFQEKVARQIKPGIPPIKKLPEFTHIPYRSPVGKETPFTFVNHTQESSDDTIEAQSRAAKIGSCKKARLAKSSQPLEAFALETLIMRGILYSGDVKKAIIEAGNNQLHIVKVGDIIGSFHGKIISIDEHEISVEEWIPDGLGCFRPRSNQLLLTPSALNE